MTTPDQFYRDLEVLLEREPGTIDGTEHLSSLNWDSMAILEFIAMADQKYSVSVPAAQIVESSTVANLLAVLSNP